MTPSLPIGLCQMCGCPCAPEEEHGCDSCTEAADEARASATAEQGHEDA